MAREHFSSIPHLKLKKAVLGYNDSSDLFNKIGRLFDFYRIQNGLELPEMEYSSLWKRF
jgi:hypothetical protein